MTGQRRCKSVTKPLLQAGELHDTIPNPTSLVQPRTLAVPEENDIS